MSAAHSTMSPWQPICEASGLWAIEHRAGGFWLRTTLLVLADQSLLLVSPIRNLGQDAVRALEACGTPRLLLAPNHYHHLGLPEYTGRYPGAVVVASDVAAPRLRKQTSLPIEGLAVLRDALPAHAQVLEPAGLKNGETWLAVRTKKGLAWVVSDAFFNLPHTPSGAIGLFLRLTGTCPGLRIGSTFLWLGVGDRQAYRAWLLQQLANDPPAILVPGHGDVIEDENIGARLSSLAEARL